MQEKTKANPFFRPAVFLSSVLFFFIVKILPYRAYRTLAKGCVFLYYLTAKKLRRHAIESLTIVFADRLPPEEKQRIAKESFLNLAEGLAGLFYASQHPDVTQRIFSWEGREHLDNALKLGKGAILAVAHFGPFAWALLPFIGEGHKTSVILRPPRSSAWRDEFVKRAAAIKLGLVFSVPVRQCVAECSQILERGELLAMPVDQNYGASGRVFVNFLGKAAATAPGPVVFALKTGVPILPVFALPDKGGRFRIVIEPPVAFVSQKTDKETIVYNTAALTARVEHYVRKFPEQWSWMHKRWKTVPRDGEI